MNNNDKKKNNYYKIYSYNKKKIKKLRNKVQNLINNILKIQNNFYHP